MRSVLILATAGVLAGAIAFPAACLADPIHRIENDAYWHHDSGWIFPARLGEFVREGSAQDVAGSRDAVAHYVQAHPLRMVVSVDVFPADSAAAQVTLESARAALVSEVNNAAGRITEGPLALGNDLDAACVRFMPAGDAPAQALYFVTLGDWRVRIRAVVPAVARGVMDELDAFVKAQRWDTLR